MGCLIDAQENSEALSFIIDNVDHDVVADVADILGFMGGGSSKMREDDSRFTELRGYMKGLRNGNM